MLIELEDFKNHIDLNTNDDDATITTYILGVGEFLRNKLGRAIEEEEVEEIFDGDNLKDTIFLANYPVRELTSLKYRTGTFGSPVWNDFNVDDYLPNLAEGTILLEAVYSGLQNIKVNYWAGYAAEDIPNALKVAVLKLVAKVYNKRRSDGFSTEEVAGASINWDSFMSSDIVELINPYRKISI